MLDGKTMPVIMPRAGRSLSDCTNWSHVIDADLVAVSVVSGHLIACGDIAALSRKGRRDVQRPGDCRSHRPSAIGTIAASPSGSVA